MCGRCHRRPLFDPRRPAPQGSARSSALPSPVLACGPLEPCFPLVFRLYGLDIEHAGAEGADDQAALGVGPVRSLMARPAERDAVVGAEPELLVLAALDDVMNLKLMRGAEGDGLEPAAPTPSAAVGIPLEDPRPHNGPVLTEGALLAGLALQAGALHRRDL